MVYVRRLCELLNLGANHDFCPWANRYVYVLKRPLGWVVLGLVASLLLGIAVSPKALFATAAVVALAACGALWPWIGMWGIRGRISWNTDRCEEGQDIEVTFHVTNRWFFPAWGLVVHTDPEIASRSEAPGAPIALSRVAPMAESRFTWSCRPSSRGIFPRSKVRLVTSFPFGLWSFGREVEVHHPLTVWPRTTRLEELPDQIGNSLAAVGAISTQSGQEGDWSGVRPFREGDSLRQVHWAQSARRDSLLVCERLHRSQQHGLLWLDLLPCQDDQLHEASECLIRMFASIAKHFSNHAWSIQVCIGEKSQWLHPGAAPLQRFLDELAGFDGRSIDGGMNGPRSLPSMKQASWFIGVSTLARFQHEWRHYPCLPASTRWALLDSQEGQPKETNTFHVANPHENVASLRNVFVVEQGSECSTPFSRGWQRSCTGRNSEVAV